MLLKLEKIDFRYGEAALLRDLSATIGKSDHIALVGPNGCGKSTLIKILCANTAADSGTVSCAKGLRFMSLEQVAPPQGEETVRSYVSRGLETWRALERRYNEALASLETQPDSDEALTEFGEAESEFTLQGGHAFPARLDAALTHLGLSDSAESPAHELSGGQRHRCRLARLLLTPSDLWILDEPTNHLDDEGIDWLIQLLGKCRHAWLVVSHDRHLLESAAQRIWELDYGRIESYAGPYSTYLKQRSERRRIMQIALDTYKEDAERLQAFVTKWRAGTRSKQASSRARALEKLVRPPKPPSARRSLPINFSQVPRSAEEVLNIRDLSAGFEQPLVAPFSTQVRRGERIVVKGANGCGKTTLLRTMIGDLPALGGECLPGVKVQMAMLGQQVDAVLGSQLAGEWLENHVPIERIQQARNLAGGLGLDRETLARSCEQLSGGERMRLALSSLLLRDLNVLILDEPTNHLDLAAREGLEEALVSYPGTLFIVSHDRAFCERIGNRWWYLRGGRLEEADGVRLTTEEAQNEPQKQRKGSVIREQMKARRRAEAKCQKKEKELDILAQTLAQSEIDLAAPEMQSDWEALGDLQDKHASLLADQGQAEEAWMALCAELEELESADTSSDCEI